MSSVGGISLATWSTSAYGRLSARPTSRTTARAFIVPKVMICATFSRPYLRVTYSMTSPRRRSQKSMSMSGSDTRSGFRKRSKIRSKCSGSTSVMFRQYATRLPAADPRPGTHRDAAARARTG